MIREPPGVQVELSVDYALTDFAAHRFDAGAGGLFPGYHLHYAGRRYAPSFDSYARKPLTGGFRSDCIRE